MRDLGLSENISFFFPRNSINVTPLTSWVAKHSVSLSLGSSKQADNCGKKINRLDAEPNFPDEFDLEVKTTSTQHYITHTLVAQEFKRSSNQMCTITSHHNKSNFATSFEIHKLYALWKYTENVLSELNLDSQYKKNFNWNQAFRWFRNPWISDTGNPNTIWRPTFTHHKSMWVQIHRKLDLFLLSHEDVS